MAWVRQLLRRGQINRAVAYGIVNYAWRTVTGPVSIFLIGTRFSPELQGYYYTFSSLLALQVIAELGLGSVIVQFASHEWSELSLNIQGRIVGRVSALSRLADLAQFAFRWYTIAALVVMLGLSMIGFAFFSQMPNPSVDWALPWLALCALTALALWSIPLWSLLEGCNQVSHVYSFRMIQGFLTNLSIWASILLGAGLWTAAVSTAVSLIWAGLFLTWKYRHFFDSLLSVKIKERIGWRRQIWPMQWRMAISYLGGYLAAWIYTPMLFYFQGPVVAGQFGMAWALVTSAGGLATVWASPRAAQFGILIAGKRYAQLDRLLFRVWVIATVVLICGVTGVWMVVLILTELQHPFANRLLAPLPTALLSTGVVASLIWHPLSVYLRAHRREPYLALSVTSGASTVVAVWVLASHYGALGAATAYSGVSMALLPWGLWIWHRCRAAWHGEQCESLPTHESGREDLGFREQK